MIRLQDERGFAATRIGDSGSGGAASRSLEPASAADRGGERTGGRTAMRRERCVLGSDVQSGGGLRGGLAGARWCDSDVLRSHRGARRDPPADAARRDARCGARADSRDALVRRISGARRGGPQRQHHSGQQARRAEQHRGEGAGQHREIGEHGDPRGGESRREGDGQGAGVRGHTGQRFHLRHAATGVDESTRVHDGRGHAVRPRDGAGDQGIFADGAGGEVAGPDRSRRGPHRDGAGDDRRASAGNSSK